MVSLTQERPEVFERARWEVNGRIHCCHFHEGRPRASEDAIETDKFIKASHYYQSGELVICCRCGSTTHLASDAKCRARSATFHSCGKTGHFDKVCRSRKSDNSKSVSTVLAAVNALILHFLSICPLSDVHREALIKGIPVSVVCDALAELKVLHVTKLHS